MVLLSNYDKSKSESISVINQAKELINEYKQILDEKEKLDLTQFESNKQKIISEIDEFINILINEKV